MVIFIFQLWKTKAKFVRALKSDDSASMEFVESGRRKETLINILYFLARFYGTVSEGMRGIKAIRFLNGGDHFSADNLRSKEDIKNVINSHKFKGLARIGVGLMREILRPFVFADDSSWVKGTPRKLRQMERPLLVIVLTAGAVTFSPFNIDLRVRILTCMVEGERRARVVGRKSS